MSPIAARLEQLRARRPELRFAQLISIIGSLAEDETGRTLWDVEDDEFLRALDRFARDISRSEASADLVPQNS